MSAPCTCRAFSPHLWKRQTCNQCFHAESCHVNGFCTYVQQSANPRLVRQRQSLIRPTSEMQLSALAAPVRASPSQQVLPTTSTAPTGQRPQTSSISPKEKADLEFLGRISKIGNQINSEIDHSFFYHTLCTCLEVLGLNSLRCAYDLIDQAERMDNKDTIPHVGFKQAIAAMEQIAGHAFASRRPLLSLNAANGLQALIRMRQCEDDWIETLNKEEQNLIYYHEPFRSKNVKLSQLLSIERSFDKKLQAIVQLIPQMRECVEESQQEELSSLVLRIEDLSSLQSELVERLEEKFSEYPRIEGIGELYEEFTPKLSKVSNDIVMNDAESFYAKLRKNKSFLSIAHKLKEKLDDGLVSFIHHETLTIFETRQSIFQGFSNSQIDDEFEDMDEETNEKRSQSEVIPKKSDLENENNIGNENEKEKSNGLKTVRVSRSLSSFIERSKLGFTPKLEQKKRLSKHLNEMNALAVNLESTISKLNANDEQRVTLRNEKKMRKKLPRLSELAHRMIGVGFKLNDGKRRIVLAGQIAFFDAKDKVFAFFLFTDCFLICSEKKDTSTDKKVYQSLFAIRTSDCPVVFDFEEEKGQFSIYATNLNDVLDCVIISPNPRYFFSKLSLTFSQATLPPPKVFGSSIRVQTLLAGAGPIPRTVLQCCAHLETSPHYETVGLFRINGRKEKMAELREIFDQLTVDVDLSLFSAHEIASTLKKWLMELPTPLLNEEEITAFADCDTETLQNFVKSLKESENKSVKANYFVLEFLFNFFSKMTIHSEVNKMNAENIATVVGPNLTQSASPTALLKMNKVVRMFIENFDFIFSTGEVEEDEEEDEEFQETLQKNHSANSEFVSE